MRIKDDGKYEWRKDQYAEAAEQLGENTKSKGIDAATAFTIEMLSNLERAMEHEDHDAGTLGDPEHGAGY